MLYLDLLSGSQKSQVKSLLLEEICMEYVINPSCWTELKLLITLLLSNTWNIFHFTWSNIVTGSGKHKVLITIIQSSNFVKSERNTVKSVWTAIRLYGGKWCYPSNMSAILGRFRLCSTNDVVHFSVSYNLWWQRVEEAFVLPPGEYCEN